MNNPIINMDIRVLMISSVELIDCFKIKGSPKLKKSIIKLTKISKVPRLLLFLDLNSLFTVIYIFKQLPCIQRITHNGYMCPKSKHKLIKTVVLCT